MAKKKKHIKAVEVKCEEALKKIDEILAELEEKKKKYGLSDNILIEVKKEITKMKEVLDKNRYKPIYGRFITDYPTENSELVDYLLEISVFYKKYT